MGHNVWMHLSAVQEANRKYDEGSIPKMLVDERFNTLYSRDVIDAIFATSSRDEANRLIEEHSKFWMAIPGTRGAIGKKTQNASTYFGNFFDVKESTPVEDEDGLDETKLETLEVTA
jgi:hypothetical protein